MPDDPGSKDQGKWVKRKREDCSESSWGMRLTSGDGADGRRQLWVMVRMEGDRAVGNVGMSFRGEQLWMKDV